MQIKKIALIPAYEPDFSLIKLVLELRKNDFEVVIVNDGSSKECDSIFKSCSGIATVLYHPMNIGKGVALKTGLYFIRNNFNGPYVVVTADADGQHSVKDILRVCEEAGKYPDSLVLGSRQFDKDVPLRSKFGNTVTRFVYKIFSGVKVSDTQTGLRAFSQSVLPRLLKIKGDRYEYEMNVLMFFAKEKRKIREVKIETIYLEGNKSSHFDTVKDSWKIYKEILKFSASSFLSFLIDYGLYCMFFMASGQLLLSNIVARLFSASFNYTFNKKIVFEAKTSFWKSAVGYMILAAFILVGNTYILSLLTAYGMNSYIAKIITELFMFIISYTIQHRFIFRKEIRNYEKA